MEHRNAKEANEKYGGNGWTEVERLVLYRLDVCEDNICAVKSDVEGLIAQRNEDVSESQKQRITHYEKIQESLSVLSESLTKQIKELNDCLVDDKLERAEKEKTMVKKEEQLKSEDRSNRERLDRLEKIVYAVTGTVGGFVIKEILERVF